MYIKFLYWKRSLVNRKTRSLDLQIFLKSEEFLKDEGKGEAFGKINHAYLLVHR